MKNQKMEKKDSVKELKQKIAKEKKEAKELVKKAMLLQMNNLDSKKK